MRDITFPQFDDWVSPFLCVHCGTEAIGEAVDLRSRIKTSGYIFADTLRGDRVFYFDCPNPICDRRINVDTGQIPSGLQLQVAKRESDT